MSCPKAKLFNRPPPFALHYPLLFVIDAKESLIPLNFRLLSAGPDWAIMAWDAPTCSALEDEFDVYHGTSNRRTTQRASPCASGAFPLTYQLRYAIMEVGEAATTNGAFGEQIRYLNTFK